MFKNWAYLGRFGDCKLGYVITRINGVIPNRRIFGLLSEPAYKRGLLYQNFLEKPKVIKRLNSLHFAASLRIVLLIRFLLLHNQFLLPY